MRYPVRKEKEELDQSIYTNANENGSCIHSISTSADQSGEQLLAQRLAGRFGNFNRMVRSVLRLTNSFLICCISALLLIRVSAQNQGAAAEPSDAPQVRAEILAIESILPTLVDRGPALFQLAHDYVYLGELDKGISILRKCIALKEGFDPEGDHVFSKLKNNHDYALMVSEVQGEYPLVRNTRLAFTIPEQYLIPEGLAVDLRRHLFYVGSLYLGKIVRVAAPDSIVDFVDAAQYKLRSICGMKVGSSDGDLWANTCPYDGIGSELTHFDARGRMIEHFSVDTPSPHLFNDLVLRQSEGIYLTDSLADQVFRFDRRSHAFTPLKFSRSLYYPNGIAISDDGKWLYVSDAFGTLQYDFETHRSHEVQPGTYTTVSGFDGLYWYHNSLIGIQNSLGSPRVARFRLSDDGLRVTGGAILENRSDFVSSPTTGAVDGSRFYFMANTHIDNLREGKIVDEKQLEPVKIGVLELR